MRSIDYIGAYYDEREKAAVNKVLDSSIRVGENVAQMEQRTAQAWGKAHGIMVNSGSSALQVAYDLLAGGPLGDDLPLLSPGDEFITSAVTFSTTVAPGIRAGFVPVVIDVDPNTYQIDVSQIEDNLSKRTKAMVVPNLAGNCPDWDALRDIADRHRLWLVEDSCDTFGAKLRGTPTGTRADISVTSFAMSHIITAMGTGGMVMVDRSDWWDKALLLRRWGRSSETRFYGTQRDQRGRFVRDLDGIAYDQLFVFELLGHNFEPSEVAAAFGLVQLDRVAEFAERRRHNARSHMEFLAGYPEIFVPTRELDELETCWLQFPVQLRPDAPFSRPQFQAHMKQRGVATRMVWTGNLARQPMMAKIPMRQGKAGLENADAVMEHGVLIPCHQMMTDDDLGYIHEAIEDLIAHGPQVV